MPGRHYQLQVARSGLRLEVAFGSLNSAPIIQGPGAPTYRPSNWRFDVVPNGFYLIVNRNSALCLDAGPASVRVVIYQRSCGVGASTHWAVRQIGAPGEFRVTGQSLCVIGDLTFSAVPLVSDISACDMRFRLLAVN